MGKMILEYGDFGWDYILREVGGKGRTILIQSDWDYAGYASHMGWTPACYSNGGEFDGGGCGTDGTISCNFNTCRNPKRVSDHLSDAQDWIDNHIGEEFDDPGYFN